MQDQQTAQIRDANDRFRQGDQDIPGQWFMTQGMAALIEEQGAAPVEVLSIVQQFDAFTTGNDPYGLHDFGAFTFGGEQCFWKIDSMTRRWSLRRTIQPICLRRRAS